MIVGCSGFPVAQERYWRDLSVVEVETTLLRLPKPATAAGWRERAPASAVFLMKAWQIITHPADHPGYRHLGRALRPQEKNEVGHFKPTDTVREAWAETLKTAQALQAKVILFQTPATFYPGADSVSNLYSFFKKLPRQGLSLAWEPRGAWDTALLQRISKELRLTIACDPLRQPPLKGSWRYLRAPGRWKGPRPDAEHIYTKAELKALEGWARGPGYLVFANRARWEDARRFRDLCDASRLP